MKQVKILHCADLHLGSELSRLGRKSVTRRAELKNTFFNILDLCRTEDVQLLLVAGDLFDNVHIKENILDDIRNGFASLENTIIAIAPGNHDPLTEDSPYAKKDFWPDNVVIFKGSIDNIVLENLGVRLWGGAFTGTYESTPLLKNIKCPNDELINICVLHGELVGTSQQSDYNPITEKQIAYSGMDYVALGHIHKQTEILKSGGTYYAYSGCPEGRGFDELEEKGVYLGMVSKGNCRLEYRKMCQRMNIELHVDISEAVNSRAAADMILDKMRSKYGDNYLDNLYKVILEGEIADNVRIDCEDIKAFLNDVFFIKVKDNTNIRIDFDAVSNETTLRSIFIRKMKERISDANPDEKDKIETALRIGLKAFFGEVKYGED